MSYICSCCRTKSEDKLILDIVTSKIKDVELQYPCVFRVCSDCGEQLYDAKLHDLMISFINYKYKCLVNDKPKLTDENKSDFMAIEYLHKVVEKDKRNNLEEFLNEYIEKADKDIKIVLENFVNKYNIKLQ